MSEDMFHFIEEMDDDPEVINDGLAEAAADGMFSRMRKNAGFPSYSTFVRARYDAQFRDVKKREKHFHCRCATCSDLSTKIHLAPTSDALKADYKQQLKAHHFEVTALRHNFRLGPSMLQKTSSC